MPAAKPATIRRIHSILSTALAFGVKWGWIESNPAQYATPPKLRPEEPEPLTPEEAGRLLVAAWEADPAFGLFLHVKMVTGAHRSEVCGLQWGDIAWKAADLSIRRAYLTKAGQKILKPPKNHQKRTLALDEDTLQLLEEHRDRCREVAEQLGGSLDEEVGFVFNRDGLGIEPTP